MNAGRPVLTVRDGSPRDLEAVVRIENESFADPWSAGALAGELLTDGLRMPLVALFGDELVGYAMNWKVSDQLHILNIAVAGAYRRAGIATALLVEAATRGQERGLVEITLEVRRSNTAAIAFYERHGFVEVGVREGYYADDGEDALIMLCPSIRLIAG